MEKWALVVCAIYVVMVESLSSWFVWVKLALIGLAMALVFWCERDIQKRLKKLDAVYAKNIAQEMPRCEGTSQP